MSDFTTMRMEMVIDLEDIR